MEKNADVYIPDFYAGRSIFITGATGFIGKALIEKLLRSCPDIEHIFILIRPKKGKDINERLKTMLDNKLFDLLRSTEPSSLQKIVPITGNLADENLGLLPCDRQILIDKVSIIFHVAASVRFDEGLKDAVFNNTRSTRDICILGQEIKQLVVLLHVSSTYTQIDKPVVEEILYPPECDYEKMIKIAESVDEHVLKVFTAKYLGNMTNTYVFTKRLAEQVISDYSRSLPCIIIRPSIIISSSNEPVPGWIDNFNGPVGMLVGGGTGILRVLWASPSISSDYAPVDATVKVMIITAWKRGIKSKEDKTVEVYHCASSQMKTLNVKRMTETGFDIIKNFPLNKVLWKPNTQIVESKLVYDILVLLLHIVPALFIDGILKLFGVRPMLLRLQRRVYVSNNAIAYFLLHEWKFKNTKIITLFNELSSDNEKVFGYPYETINIEEYFKNGIIGAKLYLLHQKMDLEDLEATKRHYKRMEWLDTITKILFVVIILWILDKKIFSYIMNIFLSFI